MYGLNRAQLSIERAVTVATEREIKPSGPQITSRHKPSLWLYTLRRMYSQICHRLLNIQNKVNAVFYTRTSNVLHVCHTVVLCGCKSVQSALQERFWSGIVWLSCGFGAVGLYIRILFFPLNRLLCGLCLMDLIFYLLKCVRLMEFCKCV